MNTHVEGTWWICSQGLDYVSRTRQGPKIKVTFDKLPLIASAQNSTNMGGFLNNLVDTITRLRQRVAFKTRGLQFKVRVTTNKWTKLKQTSNEGF